MSVVFCVLSGVADKTGAFERKSGKCEKRRGETQAVQTGYC